MIGRTETARRRPPKRRCPRCGGDHYAWQQELALCKSCKAETADDAAALAEIVRERRLERVGAGDVPETAEVEGDGIPY